MAPKRTHIIIAEPSAIIRSGMATLLQQAPNLSCDIAEVKDISSLTTRGQKELSDLVIINPSHLGGVTPSQLRADMGNDNLKIIALQSAFADQSLLQNFDDVISIYDSQESIIEKVDGITVQKDDEPSSRKELSIREREIIVCVVKGMTNKQIADTLCLSTHTVIAHRRNIASKLQIHSPSGLTIYAIVNKLVDLSDIKNSITSSRDEE